MGSFIGHEIIYLIEESVCYWDTQDCRNYKYGIAPEYQEVFAICKVIHKMEDLGQVIKHMIVVSRNLFKWEGL